MPLFYKTHGKHCFLRSFQTTCQRCGADVLFWECTHGSRIFFNYPPYGKLIRHRCSLNKGKNIKKFPIIVKTPEGLLKEPSPSCPACGKLFKYELHLKDHLKHCSYNNEYFKNIEKEIKTPNKPKFGRINIKGNK